MLWRALELFLIHLLQTYVTNNKLFFTQKKEIYDWKKFLEWKGDWLCNPVYVKAFRKHFDLLKKNLLHEQKLKQWSRREKWHTGIPGLWTQELDAGRWKLDSRRWTLDAGLDWFRTKSEPSFWFFLVYREYRF